MTNHKILQVATLALLMCTTLFAQATDSRQAKLDVVGTAHLDTQWRWTIQNTINEFVPLTFRENFKLMDIYPDYVFSLEGSFRYKLFREYYPDEYAKLKKYVDSGQWRVTGSWVDAVDVNIPSFESLVRHNLYGNGFYKKEFGKTSRDIFLPDCFGFGYALPSIAAHCGLKSFTTQKLTWGSAVGVPFDIGLWQGVDGSKIIACLNAGDYTGKIKGNLSRDTTWQRKIAQSGESTGLYAGYTYFGTGDTGGSPESLSVDWLQKSVKSNGPIRVASVGADDLVELVKGADQSKLPLYNGELLMTRHGAGCYTSQAAMKRWNRKNELLADAAERASVIAHLTAGVPYPSDYLRDTWERFLWHQFHDDLTGTSIPEAYEFSWNDEILCQNRFVAALESASSAVLNKLDTDVDGTPIVVYNPLAMRRNDLVEFPASSIEKGMFNFIYDSRGHQIDCQISIDGKHLMFSADAVPAGYAVFNLSQAGEVRSPSGELRITSNSIENYRYAVTIDAAGNISSIMDKVLARELLTAPIQFQLIHNKPRQWPAWELQYEDIILPPRAILKDPVEIKVIESGPVRASIEILRKTDASTFKTTVSLVSNSDRIEFKNEVDWYEKETLLKVAFPLTCANDSVTYDLGLGAIKRGLNTKQKYEVPGHQWADMADPSGEFGVAILNDCKYGWDHPEAGILRLTLIHTPGVFESWNWVGDQKSQDMGHHEFTFAICAHKGDWSESDIPEQAARLNQPLIAFATEQHSGGFGREFSLLNIDARPSSDNVFVNAVKMSEAGDELIVRVKETKGKTANAAKINFAFPIESAREVSGFEDPVGVAIFSGSALEFSLTPYQPKAFAVKLKTDRSGHVALSMGTPVDLPYNQDGISLDDNRTDGDFDGLGNTLAGELLPEQIIYRNIAFVPGPKEQGRLNVLSCQGQTLDLSNREHERLCLLVCSVGGATEGDFEIHSGPFSYGEQGTRIQDYAEPIGQWNNRLVGGRLAEERAGIAPGYVNREDVAWYGSHRHTAKGENEAYRFTYLFLIDFALPGENSMFILPKDNRIKVLAATVAQPMANSEVAAHQLIDELDATLVRISADSSSFVGTARVSMTTQTPGAKIHYTLDGSEPTMNSAAYVEPITLNSTSTVKARAISTWRDDHFVTSATYRRLVPHDASAVGDLKPGLSAAYYEGEWQKLPAFDSLKAKETYIADSISLPTMARAEDFGLTFEGYFLAPAEGLYEFAISSDDGSKVFVGDSLVVDNDGLHGGGDVVGQIALKTGYHPLSILMFQCKGGRELDVHVSGPGLARERLRSNRLFRETRTSD